MIPSMEHIKLMIALFASELLMMSNGETVFVLIVCTLMMFYVVKGQE